MVHISWTTHGVPSVPRRPGWRPALAAGRGDVVASPLSLFRPSLPEHDVAEHGRGVSLHAREDVLVDGHRERRAAVAEALAHDFHRDTGLQQERGVRVAEVVHADSRQSGLGDVALKDLAEQVGVRRAAVERGEDDAGVVGSVAEGKLLFELCLPPGPHHGDGSGVEVDRAPACVGLDVGEDELVGDVEHGMANGEACSVEVHVVPPEPEHLAAAHAGVGGEEEGRGEAVIVDLLEELAELRRRPDRISFLAYALGFGASARSATLRSSVPLRQASARALRSIPWMIRTDRGDSPPPAPLRRPSTSNAA